MLKIKQQWHQWAWILLIIFGIGGIWYPAIGTVALLCMLAPVITAFWKGRNWCGHYCPRGSFNDYLLARITLKRGIPKIFKEYWFKLLFLVLLMGAFLIQIRLAWGNLAAVGLVFVRMVIITTLLGILLGMIFDYRAWCVICPMGTMARLVAGMKKVSDRISYITFIKDQCVDCKLCSRYCPVGIDVPTYRKQGLVDHGDCLKCQVCVGKCPKQSLYVG